MYILNEIDRVILGHRLIEIDNANAKNVAHRDILEALVVVGKQIMIDCMNEIKNYKYPSDCAYEDQNHLHGTFVEQTLNKYKKAIVDYCAYSQTETIKFLITYNSKKTVCFWDLETGTQHNMQFKNKTEMKEHIDLIQRYHRNYSEDTSL